MAELIGAVVLIVSAEDLVAHLQQALIILMDAEQGMVIGLKTVFQKRFDAKCMYGEILLS